MDTTRSVGSWILAAGLVLGTFGLLPSQAVADGDTRCYTHTDEATVHGQIVDGRVVLNVFDQGWWGDHWASLTIGEETWEHPEAGVPYGQEVTVWIICKGDTTTSTTETTTTTTTTRPTTTTETTTPSSTTSTTDPTTTTTAPISSTTSPSTTTPSTVPPSSPTVPSTMPITGIEDVPLYIGFTVALLSLGGLILLAAKRR